MSGYGQGYGGGGGGSGMMGDRISSGVGSSAYARRGVGGAGGSGQARYTPSHIWTGGGIVQEPAGAGYGGIDPGLGMGMGRSGSSAAGRAGSIAVSPRGGLARSPLQYQTQGHGMTTGSGAGGPAPGSGGRFLSPAGSFIGGGPEVGVGSGASLGRSPRATSGGMMGRENEGVAASLTSPPVQSIYEESAWRGALPQSQLQSQSLSQSQFQTQNNAGVAFGVRNDRWVTVFGFPASSASFVLRHMQRFGDVVAHKRRGGTNWMHIQYQTPLQAQMALSINGTVLGGGDGGGVGGGVVGAGSLMIGVRPLTAAVIEAEGLDASTVPAEPVVPSSVRRNDHFRDDYEPFRSGAGHSAGGRIGSGSGYGPRPENSFFSKVGEYLFGW